MTVPDENLSIERWEKCIKRAQELTVELRGAVEDALKRHKTVVGYGASAKSSFWIQSCGFTRREIKFICDDTKAKWFRTSPGTDIIVIDEGALIRELPNYAINFAWNYRDEVIKRQEFWIGKGGKFIVPLPQVQIVP